MENKKSLENARYFLKDFIRVLNKGLSVSSEYELWHNSYWCCRICKSVVIEITSDCDYLQYQGSWCDSNRYHDHYLKRLIWHIEFIWENNIEFTLWREEQEGKHRFRFRNLMRMQSETKGHSFHPFFNRNQKEKNKDIFEGNGVTYSYDCTQFMPSNKFNHFIISTFFSADFLYRNY
jgi:hypothetical protein